MRTSVVRLPLVVSLFLVASLAACSAVADGSVEKAASPTTESVAETTKATAPTPVAPRLRLAAVGDVGTGRESEYLVAASMDAVEGSDEYDAVILLGDNVYPDGDPTELDEKLFAPFAGVLDGPTRLLAVLGNHDVIDDNGDLQALALGMPARWYASRFDDVLIVSLDSTQRNNPEQFVWLDEVLKATDARWKIVTMHHPPFSAGHHGSSMSMRENLQPIVEANGVQLVLAAHDHDYQRNVPINGVIYIVSGGGSELRAAGREDFTDVSLSVNHFLDIEVWQDELIVQAIDISGNAFDEFIIR